MGELVGLSTAVGSGVAAGTTGEGMLVRTGVAVGREAAMGIGVDIFAGTGVEVGREAAVGMGADILAGIGVAVGS